MQDSKTLVPLSIVVAGVLIALAIYFGGSGTGKPTTDNRQPTTNEINIAEVSAEDHIIGSKDAKLVVVEYSDTECPFCKNFHYTMKQVLADYQGDVAWVYRHFPIAQLHSKAPHEAEATECAGELGGNQGFWNYINEVFERTNSNNSLDPSQLPLIAGDVGLDTMAFNECLSSGRYTQFVQDSIEEAVKAGARGTPYSVIIAQDGTKVIINGAEPLASVKAKIDSLLR